MIGRALEMILLRCKQEKTQQSFPLTMNLVHMGLLFLPSSLVSAQPVDSPLPSTRAKSPHSGVSDLRTHAVRNRLGHRAHE
jgi:hypothetical protein